MRAVSRLVRLMPTIVVAVLVVGCGVATVDKPPTDDLSTWQAVPLQPDPALEAIAASAQSSCRVGPQADPVRLLLQDRRTTWTAAFLFIAPGAYGDCFVTTAIGGMGGGSGPLPDALSGVLTIDSNGAWDIADGKARLLGGRVGVGVTRVEILLDDGRGVTASVRDGYWLAWWPDGPLARGVTAFDAFGVALASVAVPR